MEAVDGVDVVGMDSCLEQTIEVQATICGFAAAISARLVRQVDLLAWKLRAGMKRHRR